MFCGMCCWFGGGCNLAYLTESRSWFAEVKEPVKLLLDQHGWWPAMEPAVQLLACFSSRDRFWRFVHWIMLHICDKYSQIILFPKESGCELQELSCRIGSHWNWLCKARTWETVVREYGIEPYISARYNLCQTGMAWFRFITSAIPDWCCYGYNSAQTIALLSADEMVYVNGCANIQTCRWAH